MEIVEHAKILGMPPAVNYDVESVPGNITNNNHSRNTTIKSINSSSGGQPSLFFAWGASVYSHCKLNFTERELRQRSRNKLGPAYETGGLGQLIHQDLYEVWFCIHDHACALPTDRWFCFVLNETIALRQERAPEQWIPWGRNGDLRVCRSCLRRSP